MSERERITAARDDQIARWWDEGLTAREIARRLGWSLSRAENELYHRMPERGHRVGSRKSR